MDVTAIRNDSNTEGYIYQEILPHKDTKSGNAVQIDKKLNKESDALSAVKLDPAVLEAQITITRNGNTERPTAFSHLKNDKGDQEVRLILDAESERRLKFERAMYMQRAALMSLSGEQLTLLMRYVDTLRVQRQATQKQLECAFCKNNGQPEIWYTSHGLKDGKGRVRCPVLRALRCRRCGATGDHAHTVKYCPTK